MNQARKPSLKVAQILMLALIGGLVSFTAVTIFLNITGAPPQPPQPPQGQQNILMLALVGLCVLETPVFFLAPMMILKSHAPKWAAAESDEERETLVLTVLQTISIIRGALVEGIGLFGTVIYLLEREPLVLIAPAFAIVVMIGLIPTRDKKDAMARRLASPM